MGRPTLAKTPPLARIKPITQLQIDQRHPLLFISQCALEFHPILCERVVCVVFKGSASILEPWSKSSCPFCLMCDSSQSDFSSTNDIQALADTHSMPRVHKLTTRRLFVDRVRIPLAMRFTCDTRKVSLKGWGRPMVAQYPPCLTFRWNSGTLSLRPVSLSRRRSGTSRPFHGVPGSSSRFDGCAAVGQPSLTVVPPTFVNAFGISLSSKMSIPPKPETLSTPSNDGSSRLTTSFLFYNCRQAPRKECITVSYPCSLISVERL